MITLRQAFTAETFLHPKMKEHREKLTLKLKTELYKAGRDAGWRYVRIREDPPMRELWQKLTVADDPMVVVWIDAHAVQGFGDEPDCWEPPKSSPEDPPPPK